MKRLQFCSILILLFLLPYQTVGADDEMARYAPEPPVGQPAYYFPIIQNGYIPQTFSAKTDVSLGSLQWPDAQFFLPTIQSTARAELTQEAADQVDGWKYIAPGVDFKPFALPDPNRVYVARMWRSNPTVFLESAVGTGALAQGRETVSGMAERYDQAINAWAGTWGGRNQVVVAINGDYFDPATGYPQNGQIQSGWYSKRYNDFEGWSGFAWASDRSAYIGQCLVSTKGGQFITFTNPDNTLAIDGLNAPRGSDELVVYTSQYATTTQTDSSGAEVVVEMERPLSVTTTNQPVRGWVTAIYPNQGSTPIPFDSVVLSASGQAMERLLASVQVGDEIGITQQISSYDSDCQTPYGGDWSNVYSGIGGAFTFLRDGSPRHLSVTGAVVRNPRTAIAMNDDFIYFIVVDGRQPGFSIGMTFDELAQFAQHELNATWGIAQDGGGSSTMVIKGQVVNVPSDQCKVSNYGAPAASDENQIDMDLINPAGWGQGSSGLITCERPVSNGMMMVAYQPMAQSSAFLAGEQVTTVAQTALRTGPGENYGEISSLPAGAAGSISHNPTGLDGVEAKGKFWWQVTFQDKTGWVAEPDLAGVASQ
jgi:hypothetical protein